MRTDTISEVGIDDNGRLFITPSRERFSFIYRSATEVHWDEEGSFLYSPRPREWSYYDWYCHIVSVVEMDERCKLILTEQTNWINIPDNLKNDISGFREK